MCTAMTTRRRSQSGSHRDQCDTARLPRPPLPVPLSLCRSPEPPAGRLWGGGNRWFVEATLVPTVPSPDFQEDPEATAQPFCLLVPSLSHMNAAN